MSDKLPWDLCSLCVFFQEIFENIQSGPIDTEMMELGYDWDTQEAYETAGMNGTDSDSFAISPCTRAMLWMQPLACAKFVMAKTSEYEGWREINVEGNDLGIYVTVFGGKFKSGKMFR